MTSFSRLSDAYDFVVVEGAGSPAEINLRDGDIANMGFAREANVPVVLVGDIDRGGVIAAIVGTRAVLDADDAAMIHGFIVNKFRGDPALFTDGYEAIAQRSGWQGFGIVPWLSAASKLPSEDTVPPFVRSHSEAHRLIIACPLTPHIANFDDLDPLRLEPAIDLRIVPPGQPLPADADIIVLAGSKATIADLHAIRREGWDIDIRAHRRRGGHIVGLCGGYQMLGASVDDPHGIEGAPSRTDGLGLLDVQTRMEPIKTLRETSGTLLGAAFAGYEMHLGLTEGADTSRAPVRFADGRSDGAASADGRVMGTYVHGLFGLASARAAWLAQFGLNGQGPDHLASVDAALDEIAAELETHLNIDGLLKLAGKAANL